MLKHSFRDHNFHRSRPNSPSIDATWRIAGPWVIPPFASGIVQPRPPRQSSGFTLLEVLMVVVVIATTLGILLPALSSARKSSRATMCRARLRELGALVSAYAGEHDDLFPSAMGDGPDVRNDRSRWSEYTFQVFSTFAREPWRQWSGLDRLSETLYCPSNQEWPDYAEGHCDPDFVLSASVLAEIGYLDPALSEQDWRPRLGAKVQRHGSVTFPANKVGLLEYRVWHGWNGTACEGCPTDGLFYYDSACAGSVWLIDGHLDGVRAQDALPSVNRYPTWPVMPFGMTEMGVAGRDTR